MDSRLLRLCALAAVVSAVGCGGGDGPNSRSGGGGEERNYGNVSVQVSGTPQSTVTVSVANFNIVGLAGASFGKVQLSLPPITQANTDEVQRATMIAYTTPSLLPMVYSFATNESYRLLTAESPYRVNAMAWFPKGNKIALRISKDGLFGVATINVDGTGFTPIAMNLTSNYGISVSPDGKKIVVVNSALGYTGLLTMNADGSGQKQITPGDPTYHDEQPEWLPDGRIAFIRYSSGYTGRVYVVNADGSNLTDITHSDLALWGLSVSPSMTKKTCFIYDGAVWNLVTLPFDGDSVSFQDTVQSVSVSQIDWSPDGNEVVFGIYKDDNWSINLNDFGVSPDRLLLPNGMVPEWGPYVDKWMFVGSGGMLMPSSAGFMFTETGPYLGSIVAFDATTRTTAKIKNLDAGNGAGSVIYDVTADTLKAFSYTNSLTGRAVMVVNPAKNTTYTKGAIVSFDPRTGQVASIVTHNAIGAVAQSNDKRTLRGDFDALWDADGGHRSIQGTKELKLNPATGVLAP